MNKRVSRFGIGLVLIAAMLFLAGCGSGAKKKEPAPSPGGVKETVVLYFSDDQAQYLKPEEREILRKEGDLIEEIVIKELIAGPFDPELTRTIPGEARLLSVSVTDGVAEADFSQEFRTKHWGGSSGETMTLYSVVNSLARLSGINTVQFMIEGEIMDTLAGHIGTEKPLKPDWNLVQED